MAILDADERITTLSPEAKASGVLSTMTPQRAQLKCPEIRFQEINLPAFTQIQSALLDTLTEWELPTEEAGWGLAYVDMHLVTKERGEVQKLAGEMGGRLRHLLGDSLQPCIGWDSGKFTAKAAAVRTLPGTMKLIDAQREVPFLQPLPITMLPLPVKQLRWLNRLGIRTLGQFGTLPPVQIRRAMGKEGLAAQRWALGKDDRPVLDTATRRFDPLTIDFPYPTNYLAQVVTAVMNTVAPFWDEYAATCRGVQQLVLYLHFEDNDRTLDLTFVEPTADPARIEEHLTHQLECLSWPSLMHRITVTDLRVAELAPPEQLGLFDEIETATLDPAAWLVGLCQRYGTIRYQGQLNDPTHPVAQYRTQLSPI